MSKKRKGESQNKYYLQSITPLPEMTDKLVVIAASCVGAGHL